MPAFRKVWIMSSFALGAAAMAGAVWYLFYRKRKHQRRLRPPPLMAEWKYWKFSKKIGSLPPFINEPSSVTGALVDRQNDRDALYPEASVFYFMTGCRIEQEETEEDADSARYTLWRQSFLRDKATPFCTFEIPDSIHDWHVVDFIIMGQYLLVGLDQGTTVSILVFNIHGEFLRQIWLKDTPLLTGDMFSRFRFDGNHCHLLVERLADNRIDSYKFHIDPMMNRGTCIQRNTIRMPQDKESRLCWSFPDCTGFEMVEVGQVRDASDSWIRYDHTSGALTMCQPEEMFSGRLVNWKHRLNLTTSVFNFQDQKSISVYKRSHKTSTFAALDTYNEDYFVCSKEQVGGEMAEENSAEEEGEQSSSILNIYSIRSEPKSLKALALSAVLKNLPLVKDLPRKEMITLGIPPNIATTLDEHKRWESDTCTNLGVL